MTDASIPSRAPPPASRTDEVLTLPIVIYALYLVGVFTGGFTAVIGLIMAYVLKQEGGPRAASHYIFQINTFWLALVAYALTIVLALMGLPLLLLHGVGVLFFVLSGLLGVAATLWVVVRCVIGLVRAVGGEGYPDPRTWLA